MSIAQWNPDQYNRFAAERERPFWDLASLVEVSVAPRVVDLGCGDGRLTAALHDRLGADQTKGIDSSSSMIAQTRQYASDSVTFEHGDVAEWATEGCDVVFSNAALQWIPNHHRVLERWRGALADDGQLAVQVPANADHPSHQVSRELASEWLGEAAPADPVDRNVLRPEVYAEMLDALGFGRQHVRLHVYGHILPSSADVVEWVKGTSLTRFKAVLDAADFERFVNEYRHRLLGALGDQAPYFYAFKRILIWGRLGSRVR